MFPHRSSFISPAPRSTWWTERRTDTPRPGQVVPPLVEEIAETDGLTFVGMLCRKLWDLTSSQTGYDGQPLGRALHQTTDGRWTEVVSKGVWAYGRIFGAPQALLDQLAEEARAQEVGPASLKLAIWIIRGRFIFLTASHFGLGFDNFTLPPDAIPPMWAVAPPVPYSHAGPPLSLRPNDPWADMHASTGFGRAPGGAIEKSVESAVTIEPPKQDNQPHPMNPYRLADVAVGYAIDWGKVADPIARMSQILALKSDEMFDPAKSPLLFMPALDAIKEARARAARLMVPQTGPAQAQPARVVQAGPSESARVLDAMKLTCAEWRGMKDVAQRARIADYLQASQLRTSQGARAKLLASGQARVGAPNPEITRLVALLDSACTPPPSVAAPVGNAGVRNAQSWLDELMLTCDAWRLLEPEERQRAVGTIIQRVLRETGRWPTGVANSTEMVMAINSRCAITCGEAMSMIPIGAGYDIDIAWRAATMYDAPPSVIDPVQGLSPDCYFIAAIAAIAWTQPDILAPALHPRADGMFVIPLYDDNFAGPGARRDITISSKILYECASEVPLFATYRGRTTNFRGTPGFARGGGGGWPAIIEKAHAAWIIGVPGGDRIDVVRAIGLASIHNLLNTVMHVTGRAPIYSVNPPATPATWAFMRGHAPEGRLAQPLVASAWGEPFLSATQASFGWSPMNIVPNHVYSVLGYIEEGGAMYIVLRNPWGQHHINGGVSLSPREWHGVQIGQNGIGALNLDAFNALFRSGYLNGSI